MKPDRLEDLLQAWQNGTLDEAGVADLETRLRGDAEARRRFRQLAHFDANLREWAASRSNADLAAWLPSEAPKSGGGARWYASHPGTVLAAVAAVVVLASITSFFLGDHRGSMQAVTENERLEENSTGFAVLTRVWDAEFDSSNGAVPRVGDTLPAGRLALTRGIAQLEFFSGATVLVEAGTELEIRSAWEAACSRGNARVRVPPPARGFRLQAPGMNLVDLGTEFGVRVDGASGLAEVHVFEGEVEAYPTDEEKSLLRTGESLKGNTDGPAIRQSADPALFTSIEQMDANSAAHAQSRYDAWNAWSQKSRKDPRLLANYLFKHWDEDRWDRLVNNFTLPKNPAFSGGAVGARWTQGRWPMKDALEFKGPGDRVRIMLGDASYDQLTLTGWVRVDGLDRKYNALLLTDGYEEGEPHWQIYEDGSLMFSLAYADPEKPDQRHNQIYYSPPVFTLSNQRRWHHIAVTYDSASGECVQFVDGREISREVSEFHRPGRPVLFGAAEIGNWGLPTERHEFPIRNLNGRIDEFSIYKAALAPAEILDIYENGRPE